MRAADGDGATRPDSTRPERPFGIAAAIGAVALVLQAGVIGAILPFTPLADALGFTALPPAFWALLVGVVGLYLVLVDLVKRRFERGR